ncbi:MAG: DUF952 domain-containing protein [Anaerolineae bacterium]
MILHLIAEETWDQLAPDQPYAPESLQTEGFIHCTVGDALLIQVANAMYRSEPGAFLVLDIDERKVLAEVRWEASPHPAAITAEPTAPEAAAEYGLPDVTTARAPASTRTIFPHIYGPLNRDAIVGVRRAIRAADGTFTGIEPITSAAGLNLKTPSQLADDLIDATGEFSNALARFKDHIEARINEMDKKIKGRLDD